MLDFRNTNSLWCSVIAETLARLGLRHVVIAPGSRSTPLAVAFASHPQLEAIPALDERSAAFLALGIAKRTHTPTALICTSGTAAANFFPAIIEASEGNVPLLVFTADRPPEMRDCRSGQTIDQLKLYGNFPRWQTELTLPQTTPRLLAYARQTIAHAWRRTLAPEAGPVHINCPFRDPLAPVADKAVEALAKFFPTDAFFAEVAPMEAVRTPAPSNEFDAAIADFRKTPRGLILCGPANPANAPRRAAAIARLSKVLGWPVFADALSSLRSHAEALPHLVTTYDSLLRVHKNADALQPSVVVVIDDFPTSKILREWLQRTDAPTWILANTERNRDALHGRTHALQTSIEAIGDSLATIAAPENPYLETWLAAERAERARIDSALSETNALFEGKAAWLLGKNVPQNALLFVANSMPTRDAEFFLPPSNSQLRVYSSRGASGIDGTLSTALGIAHRASQPAFLLTGDLSLLHDSNGFLHAPHFHGSLTIVLINNNGGGIFESLPISAFDPPFEKFFATPQNVCFATLCAAHKIAHQPVKTWAEFQTLIQNPPAVGIRVLEISTDRKTDTALRRSLLAPSLPV